jgi:hypothetical protein
MKQLSTLFIPVLFLYAQILAASPADAFLRPISNQDNLTLQEMGAKERTWLNLPNRSQIPGYKADGKKYAGLWSGSYWPMVFGGITYRWQLEQNPLQFASFQSILGMTAAQRAVLSPAEKFDFYMGHRNMSLSHAERSFIAGAAQRNGGKLAQWFGYCDGTALAGIKEYEPLHPITVTANGVPLTFYPDDLKALASSFYVHAEKKPQGIGRRCEVDFEGRPVVDFFKKVSNPACNDTNPGAFHIAITNRIEQGRSFVLEIDRGSQIWNHAVYGYQFTAQKLPGTLRLKKRRINMLVEYVDGTQPSTKLQFKTNVKKVDYTLHINRATDEIIGGRWNHEAGKGGAVDFIWFSEEVRKDPRGLIGLGDLRKLIDLSRTRT